MITMLITVVTDSRVETWASSIHLGVCIWTARVPSAIEDAPDRVWRMAGATRPVTEHRVPHIVTDYSCKLQRGCISGDPAAGRPGSKRLQRHAGCLICNAGHHHWSSEQTPANGSAGSKKGR